MEFQSSFFKKNRENLFSKMENNSILILLSNDLYPKNGDQQFLFRQQSDLYFLTGIKQEETSVILYKDKQSNAQEILFILKPNLKLETWEGKKLSKADARLVSGLERVSWNLDMDATIERLIDSVTIFYLLGDDAFSQETNLNLKHSRFQNIIKKRFPKQIISSPRRMLNTLRLVKSEDEIQMMQQSVDITNEAFQKVLKKVRSGLKEYEIEAEISYVFRKNGANGHAYDPIIATGINACSLHYVKNNSELKEGELLLMDFGADYNYYAADLSRTIPVSGVFTKRQKELYQLVLDVQKKSIELYVPGNTIDIVNKKTKAWMEEALTEIGIIKTDTDINKYFPHGTSHFLGIDVHDVGQKSTIFEKGMVLTCEPGLYIEEESIGIRIENDIVVAEKPIDLMKNTIREICDLEAAMKGNEPD